MVLLKILGIIYILIGVVYASYLLVKGIDPWYAFPINVIGFPFALIHNYLKVKESFKRGRV